MDAYTVLIRNHMDTVPRGRRGDFKLFAMLLIEWLRKTKIPRDEQATFDAQEGKWYQRLKLDMDTKFGEGFLTDDMFKGALKVIGR